VLVPLVVYVHRRLSASYREVLSGMALPLAGALVALAVGLASRAALRDADVSSLPRLLIVVLVVSGVYVAAIAVLDRSAIAEVRALLKRALAQRPSAARC